MLKSNHNGVLKDETTEPPQVSQSSSAEKSSTLDMSATTAQPNQDYPPMPNSQNPNAEAATEKSRIIQALGKALGALVFWKKLTLGDGREVYALCFPVSKWEVDPVSKELKPK